MFGTFGVAQAAIAFSSFAPGDVYNTNVMYLLEGPARPQPQIIAMQFTSAVTGELTAIRFAHTHFEGLTDVGGRLWADNGSGQIGSFLVGFQFADSVTSPHITTVPWAPGGPVLQTGQKYWLELLTDSDGLKGWHFADASIPVGRMAFSTNEGVSYNYQDNAQMAAFEIQAVPEPASMLAVGLGLGALALRRRRRSKACP